MFARLLFCAWLVVFAATDLRAQTVQDQLKAQEQEAQKQKDWPAPPPEAIEELKSATPEPALVPEADTEAPPDVVPETPPAASTTGEAAPMIHGRLALSLEDAIKMGLENNLDVQVQRYSPLIAEMDEEIAWGAFDPEAYADFGYNESQIPNSNILIGSDESVLRTTDGFTGLRGTLPLLGTTYIAQFDSGRFTTNSEIDALSPNYKSGWDVSIVQPLLRDLIWNQPWTQIKSSRLVSEGVQEEFRRAVMDTVRSIEDAYWNLIAADRERRVAEKSLETAKALLDQTRTQFDVGVVSRVEVTEAEAGLSQREVSLIRARNAYRNQQDVLIDLVLGKGLRAASTLELEPTDNPVEVIAYEIELDSAVQRAFENRPEVQAVQKEIEVQEVQLAFAKNQRLPALDGVFTYGQNGLSGHENGRFDACRFISDPVERAACELNPPNLTQGNYGNSFHDWDNSPSYTARARFSIPIPNTSARKTVDRTEFELSRAETRLKRLEQTIILEVRQAARNLSASQEGIVAAEDARRAADEQLRAERIRLEYGESTPFDVLQREEQLVDRETELINAYRAYHLSVTSLDRAQGTILRNRNIAIADVAPLR